jgi:predicted SAM-dependent methyltransferase
MRQLHIGGQIKADDWELFNIKDQVGVDHVGNAIDLSRFGDRTFKNVYASHVLEHFSGVDAQKALSEWCRVLDSEGVLYLSVPNLDVLHELYADKENVDDKKRILVTQMLYGGHSDEYDVHHCGFDKRILTRLLQQAGFAKCEFVKSFGIFQDCSELKVNNKQISLNVIATKEVLPELTKPQIPRETKYDISRDVFYIMSMPRLAFTDNMFSLIGPTARLGIDGQRFNGVFWEQGMENLLENAIEKDYKYALAIDYDTFYTEYHVVDMYDIMESHPEVGILAPLQSRRGNAYPMSGTFQDAKGDNVLVSKGAFRDRILPMDTAHFGLTLIRLSELHKLTKPWFQSVPSPSNDWRRGHKDADVGFWINCKNAGIIAALAEVWIGHMELMCSWPGSVKDNFKTHYMELNAMFEGGLPQWALPQSYKPEEELLKNVCKEEQPMQTFTERKD